MKDCAQAVFDALNRPDADRSRPVLAAPRIAFVWHSTGGIVARYLLETERERVP